MRKARLEQSAQLAQPVVNPPSARREWDLPALSARAFLFRVSLDDIAATSAFETAAERGC